MSFAELGLGPEILRAVEEAGYTVPTPIQTQAIPVVLMGRDVLGVAQTGTGKTAGFTLPMIEILAGSRAKARMPRSLILAPTRELASQVAENFEKYGKYHRLTMAKLIGGESFVDQEKLLDRGVDVLIATPGRLMDLFDRGRILLNDVKILVIDEADRMLDMGFIPDVERIVSFLPKIRQTLFFSATMAPEIRRLADAFLMNPKEISVAPPLTTALVSEFLVICDDVDKREALRHLIRIEDVKNAFIFCNRKRDVDILFRSLAKHGFDVVQLHGDMAQSARTETLDRFRKDEVRLMVCSDVAARGIDISNLSHVFNFDVPHHSEDYVHRIGRTGRAGKEGRAFTLATPDDGKFLAAITKQIGREIPRLSIEGLPERDIDPTQEGRRRGKPSASGRPSRSRRPAAEPVKAEAPPPERAPVTAPPTERPPAERPAAARPHFERPPQGDRHRRGGRWNEEIGELPNPDNAVGFGLHVPDFILVDPGRYTSEDTPAAAAAVSAESVQVEEPARTPRTAQKSAEKPTRAPRNTQKSAVKPTRASRNSKKSGTEPTENPPELVAESAPDGEPPAPAKPKRRRKKPVAADPAAV